MRSWEGGLRVAEDLPGVARLRRRGRLCVHELGGETGYFVVTSEMRSSGYSWFHCSEMLSKVSRKVLLWPEASGAVLRSTASGYGPEVCRTCSGTSSRWASCPRESLKITVTVAWVTI